MQVPHKASAARGSASRSSPLTSPEDADPKCQKSAITCGLPMISKPSLKILAEHSSPRTFAAQPSVSHRPAVSKKRTRRSGGSSMKLDKDGESVNPKKRCRNGISLIERSDFLTVNNWNCSRDLTVGSEGRINNNNSNKRSCSSPTQPQGDSLPVQALEAEKCRDTIQDCERSGPIDDKGKRLPYQRERSKKQIPRKCNGRTIHSAAPSSVNREIGSVVSENNGEPVRESHNARSRGNISNDAPKTSHNSVSKISRLRDPRRRAGMIASPPDRFFPVPVSSGSQEQHILHEKSPVTGVDNNKKPSTASFMPTRQWVGVGRRRHRSRDRRTSITLPVSASSIMQQEEGCDPSRRERIVSAESNRLESAKDGTSGIPQLKVKLNGRTLPATLSEYGARPGARILSTVMTADGIESNQKSSKNVQLGNSILVAQKNTRFQHEEISYGKKREEKTSKISRFAKRGNSSLRVRSDDRDLKPVGAVDNNESNTGLSDQMNSTRQENSLLYDGTRDDWNDVFDAPKLASKSSCLTSFEDLWKEMESVQATDKYRSGHKGQAELIDGHSPELQTKINEEREPIVISQSATVNPATPCCLVPQGEDISTDKSCRALDTGAGKFGPLFKRVLSALIFEDGRTFEGDDEEIMSFLQSDDEDYKDCKLEDSLIEGPPESMPYGDEGDPCDDGIKNIQSGTSNDKLPKFTPRSTQNEQGLYNLVEEGFRSEELTTSGSACSDESYQRMSIDLRLLLELQSIGIFPESLLGSEEARSKLLTETISKGTPMNHDDLEGLAEEAAGDPRHTPGLVQRKTTASSSSNPEIHKDAVSLHSMPVRHASGSSSNLGKQHALLTAGAPKTKGSVNGGETLSSIGGALSNNQNGIRAGVLANNTSKSKTKEESNAETAWGKQSDGVLAASEATTNNVNGNEETGSMNPIRTEESSGPTQDMLDGMDLSHWLDTGSDDALEEGDFSCLDIPMDDLSNVGLLL